MIPISILRMLRTLRVRNLRYLLMGGQACVLYGGAQFSKDTDIHLVADQVSLAALRLALADLKAEVIAVPPFEEKYLELGLAVHFRCYPEDELQGTRLDIMTKMRNAPPFAELWDRRTTLALEDGTEIDAVAIQDLVQIKKTRRDKDWPMIRNLVESHYANFREDPTPERTRFWLLEGRTPELLIEVAAYHLEHAQDLIRTRPLLQLALGATKSGLHKALAEEEQKEREKDEYYWRPLVKELHRLRSQHRSKLP